MCTNQASRGKLANLDDRAITMKRFGVEGGKCVLVEVSAVTTVTSMHYGLAHGSVSLAVMVTYASVDIHFGRLRYVPLAEYVHLRFTLNSQSANSSEGGRTEFGFG
mgnify:CR=1 FL=1